MIRFILPSTDTPWQKAEELGLKDKLAMKVGTVMMIVMMVMKVDTGVHWTVIFLVVENGRGRYKHGNPQVDTRNPYRYAPNGLSVVKVGNIFIFT